MVLELLSTLDHTHLALAILAAFAAGLNYTLMGWVRRVRAVAGSMAGMAGAASSVPIDWKKFGYATAMGSGLGVLSFVGVLLGSVDAPVIDNTQSFMELFLIFTGLVLVTDKWLVRPSGSAQPQGGQPQ